MMRGDYRMKRKRLYVIKMIKPVARNSSTLPMFFFLRMVDYCLISCIGNFQRNLSQRSGEVGRMHCICWGGHACLSVRVTKV